MENKLKQLQELVEHFKYNLTEYKSLNYDESNTRVDFIDKLFEILEWDVSNKQQYSEEWREVVREDKVIIQGKPKAPDYSFRIGGKRMFFVEAKKPSVDIKHDIGPAYQVRRYGYTAKVPLSILTDFEEFAVYDTRIKPNKNDKASVARIFYCTFDEYEKNLDFLKSTFSKNAILKGSFKKYISDNKAKKGTSEVDTEFLKLIEKWRNDIARNLALRNKELNVRELNYAVQKIIDRILFLRIAEDRQTEEYGGLLKLIIKPEIYQNLTSIFKKADNKYNSGLFHSESFLSNLVIDDKIFNSIIKGLYYPDSPYEFSVLEVEILGNIYEQFLGKTIRLTPSHQAKVEEKPEVRKAGGVYYTPQFVVDYIVSKTVGAKINDKTPAQISEVKILDPACGSGSFLLGAYSYLLKYHLNYYSSPRKLKTSLKKGNIFQTGENTYYLTIKEKRNILLNNIFGVDIDSQAVEVTKLSLLLKLMEGENQESVDSLFKFSDITLLPDLSNNIKCGNSLIASDYYMQQKLDLADDARIREVNAFDWKNEFTAIFEKGGFDVVIGNPPYVRQELLGSTKNYFQQKYKVYHGTADLYSYFIEKGVSLLKPSGYFSYIVANKWLRANYGKPLRKWLKKQCILELVDFGDLQIFKGATTYPCILTIQRDKANENFKVVQMDTLNITDLNEYVSENGFDVSQDYLKEEGWALIDNESLFLIERIRSTGVSLKEYTHNKIFYGIKTGLNDAFVIDSNTRDRLIEDDPKSAELIKPFLAGKDIKRYKRPHNNKYLIFTRRGVDIKQYPSIERYLLKFKDRLQPKPKNYSGSNWKGRKPGNYKWYEIQDTIDYYAEFEKYKIIYPNICKKPEFTFDKNKLYTNQKCFIISLDDKFLLGVLNSSVFSFLFRKVLPKLRGGFYEPGYVYLKDFPIPKLDLSLEIDKNRHDEMCQIVDSILKTHWKITSSKIDSEREIFQKKADFIDKQIDRLVYDLYNLTDKEIEIIERD